MEADRLYAENVLGQRETYLSSNVRKLVCYQCEEFAGQTFDELFYEDGMLNWTWIGDKCNFKQCLLNFSTKSCCDYELAVSKLFPVSCAIHDHLSKLSLDGFKKQYKDHLDWTTKGNIILHCFDLLKSPRPGCVETSLLLVTSTLERILGDIYLASSHATHCPLLLRDLLQMDELKKALGQTVMFCLEMSLGSPSGLNLRNLAWHGFLSSGELPSQYVSFLLMLAISLGESMKKTSKDASCTKLQERSLITYPRTSLLQNVFPEIQTNHLRELYQNSAFVTASMVEFWNLAIDFYQEEKFCDVVVILLPQLEHSLRRLYACCNGFPERLQTAESSEFYTTFNEILSPSLADGSSNCLLSLMGSSFTELLQDILVYQQGPRLRDRLGHGEVDTHNFPKHFANHLLSITIAFCEQFMSKSTTMKQFSDVSNTAHSYSSLYHPLSCLRRETSCYINDVLDCQHLPKPSGDHFVSQDLGDTTFYEKLVDMILKTCDNFLARITELSVPGDTLCCENVLRIVLQVLNENKSSTLFRPRHELEIVALLRNVVGCCSQTSQQMQQTARSRNEEWQNKRLRSRQRNNYKRFWVHFPFIRQTMSLFAVIVVAELTSVQTTNGHDESRVKFFKRCLQCAENLASLSSPSKNRWQECAETAMSWMNQTEGYYRRGVLKSD